ncbi:MAG: hypothetical protein H8E10_09255 [Desulfobacterales bacterium]|nr:hypothetical protein [Desulfobacterales bacterium]
MNCRLTTPKHFFLTDIQQTIIPPSELKPDFKGSFCSVELVENQYATPRNGERLAIQATIQGYVVGYVPELASVAVWKGEESQWFKDVEQVRGQIFADYDNMVPPRKQWSANVSHVRYKSVSADEWIEYPEFCLLPPEEQGKWKIDAICISLKDD